MRYVVTDTRGRTLQGVKELPDEMARLARWYGLKLQRYDSEQFSNGKLSRAASAVWRYRNAEPDPMGDPSGDCGDLIAAHERRYLLRVVEEAGYSTPGEYNNELVARMVGSDGKVSLTVASLLHMLAIEDVCPQCGSALKVTKYWTRNYGGGWDTMEICPNCDYRGVYT